MNSNPASRLTSPSTSGASGLNPNTYSYGYNALGWTTSATGVAGTDTITHNALGRLTAESGPSVLASIPEHTYCWGYDGNVITGTDDFGTVYTNTYSLASPNELVQSDDPDPHSNPTNTQYFSYDAHGDTTAITTSSSGSILSSEAVSYNAQGQRDRYTVVSGTATLRDERFSYRGDALGQDVVVGSIQTYTGTFRYDQSGSPLELVRQQNGPTISNVSGIVLIVGAYAIAFGTAIINSTPLYGAAGLLIIALAAVNWERELLDVGISGDGPYQLVRASDLVIPEEGAPGTAGAHEGLHQRALSLHRMVQIVCGPGL